MEGLEVVVKALQTDTIGNLSLHIRFLSVSLEGVLGSGPKAVGHSIIGECLETTIAMSGLENWRNVQLSPCQLSVHRVFYDAFIGFARHEKGVGMGHVADAFLVAIGLSAGEESVCASL